MRNPLNSVYRSQLENSIIKARDIAESGVLVEFDRLCIGENSPEGYLNEEQRRLRNKLRAHGRQLGDIRHSSGRQEINKLVTEVAYEHWHRMLFARFLAENNLLMYEDGVTALSIQDCFDLAQEETGDHSNGWRFAAEFAAKMLPQIFRVDSPVFELHLDIKHQRALESILVSLDDEVFFASDSLGWSYQYWQIKKKKAHNDSNEKVGVDEISPVTQLFTEDYMVDYLMDNSLGAWWVSQYPSLELPLNFPFLRYTDEGTPVAGEFETWPKQLCDFKALDPCCGSGHFLVALFLMLVPMRIALEELTVDDAIDAVLNENLHGLELDNRCVEIAAFAIALEAWRYPGCSGYRILPEIKVSWVGRSIGLEKDDWLALAKGDDRLERGLLSLYNLFSDAPLIGSLIDPGAIAKDDLISAGWKDLEVSIINLFDRIDETNSRDEIEAVSAAKGLTHALNLLTKKYTLITTNPPYLVKGKQNLKLQEFCDSYYPAGSADIATVFFKRIKNFLVEGGSHLSVTPLNWLFIKSYKELREDLISNDSIKHVAKIGSGATAKASWDVLRALTIITCSKPHDEDTVTGIDAITTDDESRADELKNNVVNSACVVEIKSSPDCRFVLNLGDVSTLIEHKAGSYQGLATADYPRFGRKFWEVEVNGEKWEFQHSTFKDTCHYSGLEHILNWGKGSGDLSKSSSARIQGLEAHSNKGVVITQTRQLPATTYLGGFFDNNVAVIVPNEENCLEALMCYVESEEYYKSVRKIDEKLGVTNATLAKVPFDLERWQKVAEEKYPHGLPAPYSNEPTQWIFHGHPCGSVTWNEKSKTMVNAGLRVEETALQVATARLLGYQWPAELDDEMELAEEQRFWIKESEKLLGYVDDDGIACLPTVRGEKAAHERLEELLQAAYGSKWSAQTRNQLLEAVGFKNKSLDVWLRDKFFEQHCKFFQQRPFIWHIWDGLKDGFSALVNYHQFDKKKLERLIYTYLDDWIRTQNHQQSEGVDGASERLVAAQNLKERLELILEGEAPYDIFVRWKPLEEQPIGWNPDVNDGVRLNIRPFVMADDVDRVDAGLLRFPVTKRDSKTKQLMLWKKDRGKDVESAPWYRLGLEYGGKEGDRINDHHLSLAEKNAIKK